VAGTAVLFVAAFMFFFLANERNALWSNEIMFWKDGIKKAPFRVASYVHLGDAYKKSGNVKQALENFKIAAQLSQDYPEIFLRIGHCYAALGWLDDAADAYRAAIAINRAYAEAHIGLGNIYFSQGMLERALDEYKIAYNINPSDNNARAGIISTSDMLKKSK